MKSFTNYDDAKTEARKMVSLTGLDYGILKAKEFSRTVYNVIGLPKPENSFGHELLAERVRKGD